MTPPENTAKLKIYSNKLYDTATKYYLYSSALKCVRNFHELNKDPEETTYYVFIGAQLNRLVIVDSMSVSYKKFLLRRIPLLIDLVLLFLKPCIF